MHKNHSAGFHSGHFFIQPITATGREIRLLFFFLLFVPLFFPALSVPAQSVVTRVEGGFEETGPMENWLPVRFWCENNTGETIEGEIRLTMREDGPVFHKPFTLASPGRKVLTLGVLMDAWYGRVPQWQWKVIDRGSVIQEGSVRFETLSLDHLLLLAVTSQPRGINLLNGKNLSAPNVQLRVVQQSQEALQQMPEESYLYDSVSGIFWGDLSPAALRPRQVEALENWVLSGGRLLVLGGPASQSLQGSFLERLAGIRITGQSAVKNAPGLEKKFFAPMNLGRGWITTDIEIRDKDVEVLVTNEGRPMVTRRTAGLGKVCFLSFSPSSPEFAAWPAAEPFLEYLLSVSGIPSDFDQIQSYYRPGGEAWMKPPAEALQNAMYQDHLLRPPSFRTVTLLLMAYILTVGPINFFILRRKKKQEMAWITIPVIVALFLGAEYAIARHLKGTDLVVNSARLLLGRAGQTLLKDQSVFGIFSPAKRRYDIAYEAREGRVRIPAERSWSNRRNRDAHYYTDEGVSIRHRPMNMWTLEIFRGNGLMEAPEAIDGLTVREEGAIRGWVSNPTFLNLKRPLLYFDKKYYLLEDLPPGARAEYGPLTPDSAFRGNMDDYLSPESPEVSGKMMEELASKLHVDLSGKETASAYLLASVEDLESAVNLGDRDFNQRSVSLLCVEIPVERATERVSAGPGCFQSRWFTLGKDMLDSEYSSGSLFTSIGGKLFCELTPAGGCDLPAEKSRFEIRLNFLNPAKKPFSVDILDWNQPRWIPVVAASDQDKLEKVDLMPLVRANPEAAFLRPDDHAIQLRLRVFNKPGGFTPRPDPEYEFNYSEGQPGTAAQDFGDPLPYSQRFHIQGVSVLLEGKGK